MNDLPGGNILVNTVIFPLKDRWELKKKWKKNEKRETTNKNISFYARYFYLWKKKEKNRWTVVAF